MSSNLGHLFTTRRFVPLFLVQLFGALNDNIFKGALTILATYHFAAIHGWDTKVVTQVIAALFILPFFLFSAFAGQLADKYEKSRLVRLTKLWEIVAMLLGAAALWFDNVWLLFVTLFLMGTQSAFFGPLKYSLLPHHLREEELVGGNAIFEAATYVAILGGTIFGQELITDALHQPTPYLVCVAVLAVAVVGWAASFGVPRTPSESGNLAINPNIFSSSAGLLRYAATQRGVFRSILGISWFWAIGIFWLTLVPAYVKDHLHGTERDVTTFFVIFSIGVAVGSLVCNRMLRGAISAKYVPLAGIAVTVFMADVAGLTAGFGDRFATEVFSLYSPLGLRLAVDLAGVAIGGGIFSVPLYAMMQAWAEPTHRSRTIAANNVLNALFMTGISVVTGALFAAGLSTSAVVLIVAGANFAVSLYIITLVPESMIHTVFRWLLRGLFKVEVRGVENYAAAGARRVIIANHTSFLDAVLLTVFLPERPTFAINTTIAKRWWLRPFLWAVNVHPLDPTKPMAIKILTDLARTGTPIVIFPEGRLTVTGAIMKVYEGPGLIADKADADLIPVQIDGAMYSPFSRLKGKVRQRWFPKITLTILPPRKFHPPAELRGKAGRQYMARELYEMLAGMYVATADTSRTLFQSLLDASFTHGRGLAIIDDVQFKPFTFRRLVAASIYLGPKLCRGTPPGEPVGLLIANSTMAVASFFAVQSAGRVCAMLNYSAGPANLVSACATARVRHVWTSRRFVSLARLDAAIDAMQEAGVSIHYLEDLQKRSLVDRGRLLAALLFPQMIYARRRRATRHAQARHAGAALRRDAADEHQDSPAEDRGVKPLLQPRAGGSGTARHVEADQPAVILFTSGSSGTPKAVVLSHRNLQTNRHQLASRIDFTSSDRFFNCLPVFHAFGLMGGTLVPLFAGAPVFMYPTPLHYGVIPELVYQTNTTILFGTNTFLAGYAKRAHPFDFFSVRYVFAGAEKLKDNIRQIWSERFGVRIFEGYGSTECAPALTTNTAMHYKAGTVGRFLPGITWRLEPVPGIERGGRLWVRGENVMLGYMLSDKPGELQPPADRWYDTGDVVEVDDEGFVSIVGRARRFAKIAGEMVSLTAVEELAATVWPQALHAAVTRSHPQKGEEIVLISEQPEAKRSDLLAGARERGMSELAVPRTILFRKKLPVLGTGKPDYVTLEREVRAES